MGRGGNFEIRYNVLLDQLVGQLKRGEELVRASTQRMSATGMPGTNLSLTKRQVESQRVLNETRAVETNRIKENRQAQSQANRERERAIRGTQQHTRALSDSEKVIQHLGLALRRMILWWSTAAVILGAQRLSKEITQVVGAFQLVVKELTILGTEGEQVYQRLAAAAFGAAEITGRTFDEAADALRGWVRQGYNAVDAADLLRTTLIGLNLTRLTSTELVRTMTATMRAFNIPASDSITVIDKLVGVSRRYAIETGQLATGIRRFSASAKIANVTLDQQIGIMTAMMVRTQQSAQMVGRAGRTIFTRLRRNAVEALQTIAKVKVFTDESQQSFRSMWDILTETAGAWRGLTDVERENLAFQASGLRQREFFIALMEDFKVAQEANIESLGSVGLAYKSNALLVNTLSKSIVGLKTAWTGVLSQQSGILAFVSALVNGLRGILDVAVLIPEALIAIGSVLPALIAIGVGLFTAFSPTLLTTLIAVAGAITGLVFALGKLRGSDQQSIIQEAKELNDVMIQEAVNTRRLAGEFINLFEKQNTATDNTDLLIRARSAIERLYPGLLNGEEDLTTVYDILKDSLSTITERTIELTTARKELLRLQAEEQAFEALGTILESRVNIPKGFGGRLVEDPEDVKASLLEIRQHLGEAQERFQQLGQSNIRQLTLARRLLLIMSKTTDQRSDAEKALLVTYSQQVQTLKSLQTIRGRAGVPTGALRSDEQVVRLLNFEETKRIKTLQTTVRWLLAMEKAYTRLRQAQDQQAALDVTKRPDFDAGIKTRLEEFTPDPAIRRSIQKGLDLLKAQLTVRDGLNRLNEKAAGIAGKRVGLERLINDAQIKSLKAQIANTDNETLQLHLREALAKIQAGSVRDLEIQASELDALIQARERERTASERSAREKERDRIREQRLVSELRKTERDFTAEQVSASKARAAVAIENTLGQVAAFTFLRDEAQAAFDLARQAVTDLGDVSTLDSRIEAGKALLSTFVELQQAEGALDKAIITRAQQEAALSDKLLSIKQQEAVKITSLQEGPIAAARQVVGFAEENLKIAQERTEDARKQADIEAKITALARARSDLTVTNAEQQKELSEAEVDLEQTRLGIAIERIQASDGELVAAKVLLKQRQDITDLERDKLDGAKRSVALIQAEIEEAKALESVNKIKDRNRVDFETRIKELAAERLGIENENIIAETTLREGKLAGLNVELELIEQALADTKLLTNEKERELAVQELLNARKEVEGDITRTNIEVQQRAIQQIIQLAGQQFSAAIQGDFNAGSLIQGLSGVVATIFQGANPLVAGIVLAAGGVLGELFGKPADDLSDSLERNTNAIDRNTQTLQDVFAQAIGVPTGFTLPAAIALQGSLPGGGGSIQQFNQVTIQVDGRGQNVDQIATAVQKKLDKTFSINSRRGMGTNVLALG